MKKLIAANWKMNKTGAEAVAFIKEFKIIVKDANADIVLCPSFTALHDAAKEAKGSNIKIGAQNMHFDDSGAFTGDISPLMLKDFCEYVIIGHSERREFFKEDDGMINKKLISALKHNLKPIFCVGETWEQRSNDKTENILEGQLIKGLAGVGDTANLTVAYEPVWAISRGNPNQKAATKDDAEQAHVFIRKVLSGIFNEESAKKIRILYGGSMKPENAKELLAMKNIDGGLVGNASLNAKSFAEIVKAAE
ncbi:MAG: triose-phosphate isomerase [Nanoarchaeota archaeon]